MKKGTGQVDTLAAWRRAIEERLVALLPPGPDVMDGVAAAMRVAVLTPGKRVRPLLTLAIGRALGAREPALLDLACAVELVHCASLVLDDMPAMDDARLRRGEPTVHLRFGEDVAMLAAVALVSEACRVAATARRLRGVARARSVEVLCEAIGPLGLVHGQYRDLREGRASRSVAAAAQANDQKTGVLFAAALELAACAANRPDAMPMLREAALAIGQAFQLRDDLEDLQPSGTVPEDVLQDAGKSTVLQLLGAAATHATVAAQLERARRALHAVLGRDDPQLAALLRHAFPAADLADPAAQEDESPSFEPMPAWPLSAATALPLPG